MPVHAAARILKLLSSGVMSYFYTENVHDPIPLSF